MNNKIFILCFIIFLSLFKSSYSQLDTNSLSNSLDSLFADEFFNSTQIAIDIYDLNANKKLYSKNEKLLLRPASLQKILTTGAALLFLNDYKFQTKIYYDGEIEDSVCNGNLYVAGGFDPLFSLNDLDSLVKEIKKLGIKEIRGNLCGDISIMDSLYWGEGWMWDDDPYPFASYISALSINENSFNVIYKPSNIGEPAIINIIPQTNYFDIINNSTTVKDTISTFSITRDWLNKQDKIIASGNIPFLLNADTLKFSVAKPALYFMTLLKERLIENKIIINGNIEFKSVPNNADEIFSFERNIDTVLLKTNKESYNLGAELILRTLALEYYGKPASAKRGIKLIDSLITIAGFDPKNFKIVDGSGLSFYNLVTAELITSILKYFYYEKEDLFIKLYNTFPISGYDGTLKNRMLNNKAYKKVRAKTGTLSGVSNLAGYMFNKNNHLIAFCIMMQNFTTPAKKARDIQDKICELIYQRN
ncbi:D-alanyl-D-alanine carboxypeptidase/D-alanyl-D-alanine endopeptidase [Rosettibacter firmus]|uniref:D-alanyl-D-alanine carboxypeptidase/D-alanyl-D-alanine endopeptidase n=1 Tax=Rosettibacter firmus TaxID=3111522 RepID=UPI00336BF3C5